MSKCLPSRNASASQSYTSARSNAARVPVFSARARAEETASSLRSTPVTVAPRVALEVNEGLSFEFTEKIKLLPEGRAAALTEESQEVPAMAVVGTDNGVPRHPILLSKVLAVHRRILHRSRLPGVGGGPRNLLEAGDCVRRTRQTRGAAACGGGHPNAER